MNLRALGLTLAVALVSITPLTAAMSPVAVAASTSPKAVHSPATHPVSRLGAHAKWRPVRLRHVPTSVLRKHHHTFLDPEHQEKHVLNGHADMIRPQRKGQPWVHVDLVDPKEKGELGSLHHLTKAQIAEASGLSATTVAPRASTTSRIAASGPVTSAPESPVVSGTAATPAGTSQVPGLTYHVPSDCSGTDTGNAGNRVQVIYAYEQGAPDRYDLALPGIKNIVAGIDDAFAISSRQTDGGRRVRWVQDANCDPQVLDVRLPAGSLGADPYMTFNALGDLGYQYSNRKYLVFADYSTMLYNGNAAGVGQVYLDDQVTNNANDGAFSQIARVDWFSVSVAGHELMHTLGAVQGTAPHHTDNGHCSDGTEMMCYADGSPQTYAATVCESGNWADYDCNHDDYFSTGPDASNYLTTHFNTANSSFLTPAATLPDGPAVTLTADKTTVDTGDPVTLTTTSDRDVTWSWSSNISGCEATSTDPKQASISVTCPGSVFQYDATDRDMTFTATGTDGDGLYTSVSKVVHLHRLPGPTVSLTGDEPDMYFVRDTYSFSGQAVGAGLTYQWSLEETDTTSGTSVDLPQSNCTMTGANTPDMSFTCPNNSAMNHWLAIRLTVTQKDGQVATVGTPGIWVAARGYDVTISGPDYVQAGSQATFTATTHPDDPVTITWDAGDDRIDLHAATGPSVTFTVPADWPSQDLTIQALATDQYGVQSAAYKYIAVTAADPTPPTPTVPTPTPTPVDPIATQVTIQATGNYPAVFTGVLTDANGDPVAYQSVDLMVGWPKTSGFTKVSSTRTDDQGRIRVSYSVAARPGSFRFAYAGDDSHLAATTDSVWVKAATWIDASASVGRKYDTFDAYVQTQSGKPMVHPTMVLQCKNPTTGRWVKAATTHGDRSGNVVVSVPSPGRKTTYRWVFDGTDAYAGSTSGTMTVRH